MKEIQFILDTFSILPPSFDDELVEILVYMVPN